MVKYSETSHSLLCSVIIIIIIIIITYLFSTLSMHIIFKIDF